MLREEGVVEVHPADVQAQADRGHAAEMSLVAIPEFLGVHRLDSNADGVDCKFKV